MKRLFVNLQLKQLLVGTIAIAALLLAGCGDDDPCADVSCDFGTCDSTSGQCTNLDQCQFSGDCIPGYECGTDGICNPLQECLDSDDCSTGVCSDGACVNPSSCESNDDCQARTFCGPGGTCEPDPCNDTTCSRGVCERGTDNCVSADVCTTETEQFDCVGGERCADGECKPADTFCESIECERGECSYEAGGCGNADDCDGDDEACLDGYFCNGEDRCRPDLCERGDVDCGDEGVCVPASGECQNAENCTTEDDCMANHVCVEGSCRLNAVACGEADGDGGCSGDQICEYDDDELTATCVEPVPCTTSFDCTDDRQCGGAYCFEPTTCSDDVYEPNESTDDATDFEVYAPRNTLSGSLCSSDVDVYKFRSARLNEDFYDGTLVVEVDVPERHQGLGQLSVKLIGPNGGENTASTGAMGADGTARIEMRHRAGDVGEYFVEITGEDDLRDTGVRYDLSVNLVPSETLGACNDAETISIGQRVSGTTTDAPSSFLGSSCTSAGNLSTEMVYALEIDEPQEVTFRLTPQLSTTDLSMSVRGSCLQPASETECVDETEEGEGETLTAHMGRGTHYVVIQAPEEAEGGAFTLETESISTKCVPGEAQCVDLDTSQVCASDGGRFRQSDCGGGCNVSTGFCDMSGDVCGDAPGVDDDFSEAYDLVQVQDDYELSADGCLDDGEALTGGPDRAYRIDLPAQTGFYATADFEFDAIGAMYLVGDCGDAEATCEAATRVTGADDRLRYSNTTDQAETLYLVVDTAAEQRLGRTGVDIVFQDVICEPDALRCDTDESRVVERCDEYATEYVVDDFCGGFGCDNVECQRPLSCDDAYDATADASRTGGFTYKIEPDEFDDNHNSSACGLSDSDVDGTEGYLKVDLLQDEILVAGLTATDSDDTPALIMTTDCADPDNGCLAGETGQDASRVIHVADSDQTVWLLADSDSSSGDAFSLDVSIRNTECDPDSSSDQCGDYLNCIEPGICVQPSGNTCGEAINVTADASQPGGKTHTVPASVNSRDYEGYCGMSSDDTEGEDTVYAVELAAGETVTAVTEVNGAADPAVAIVGDCTDLTNTCLDSDTASSDATATYTATSSETVFVISDHGFLYSDYDVTTTIEIN